MQLYHIFYIRVSDKAVNKHLQRDLMLHFIHTHYWHFLKKWLANQNKQYNYNRTQN